MTELNRDSLSRVLGPAEPEVSCEECFEQLDVYVDREVAGVDPAMPGMTAHFQGCPACNEEHESLLALVRERSPDTP
jgi:hypothetical protein